MSNLLVALARIRPLEDPVKDRLAGRLLRRREVRRPDALRRVLAKDDLLSVFDPNSDCQNINSSPYPASLHALD